MSDHLATSVAQYGPHAAISGNLARHSGMMSKRRAQRPKSAGSRGCECLPEIAPPTMRAQMALDEIPVSSPISHSIARWIGVASLTSSVSLDQKSLPQHGHDIAGTARPFASRTAYPSSTRRETCLCMLPTDDVPVNSHSSSSVGARLCFLAYPRMADSTSDLASVSTSSVLL